MIMLQTVKNNHPAMDRNEFIVIIMSRTSCSRFSIAIRYRRIRRRPGWQPDLPTLVADDLYGNLAYSDGGAGGACFMCSCMRASCFASMSFNCACWSVVSS